MKINKLFKSPTTKHSVLTQIILVFLLHFLVQTLLGGSIVVVRMVHLIHFVFIRAIVVGLFTVGYCVHVLLHFSAFK